MATNSVTSKFDPMINKAESNKNRDTEFIDTLVDGQRINFYLENNNLEKYKSNKNKNVEDNDYIYDENTDKLYYREIRYPEYFEYLKSADKSLEKDNKILYNSDEIIYACSYINIEFNYPNYNTVTFKIRAKDNMRGFTTKELADKIIKYYHMLYMVNYGYNFDKGTFTSTKPSYIFHYYPDYDIYNGISGLKYYKKLDAWKVQMTSYIKI